MNRRELIAGAAGLAGIQALSVGKLGGRLTQAALQQQGAGRRVPAHSLSLKNNELEVLFDPADGYPYSYLYKGQRMWGGNTSTAILCRLAPRAYKTVPLASPKTEQAGSNISFTYSAAFGQSKAVSFRLRYALEGASLTLTMEEVQEQPGFELIEVALPQLLSVREEDGPAWFAEGRNGGSFVRLQEAKAYKFEDHEYFGRISTELPIGMVGQHDVGCVMHVAACMDGTETEIIGAPGRRQALLGTVQVHRVHGGRCYNMNDGGDAICGNAQTPNLIVGQTPSTRFDFFPCAGQNQPWLAGAKIVRARVPQGRTEFFANRFVYILAGRNKTAPAPRSTFAQSKQIVHDVAMLTDHAPQTCFISGWAYDGQDTGFPSEDTVNASLGTYEELREMIESRKAINANVTLNVNYDDAYKSSPIFNEAFIARRPDQQIWKSRAWDGEDSYVVGMAKFMEGGWGSRRIAYTMDRYKISNSILIDAMSWFAVRNDWDARHPASGYKNLVEGKYKILEQFRARGVEVTSEQMRYPFVGRLAVSMDGPGISPAPFGGEAIPLVAATYRGRTIWGTGGTELNEAGLQLFWNTRSSLWFDASSDRTKMAEFYYLVVLPYGKLHKLAVEGYEKTGNGHRLVLEQNSHVSRDPSNESYSASVNGIEIARDGSTSCPIDEHRIAFYSRTARRLAYPLPSEWAAANVTARAMTLQGRTNHPVRCDDGRIMVDVASAQPVVVYSHESIIGKV